MNSPFNTQISQRKIAAIAKRMCAIDGEPEALYPKYSQMVRDHLLVCMAISQLKHEHDELVHEDAMEAAFGWHGQG